MDVGRLEMELSTTTSRSDERVAIRASHLDLIESSVAAQDSQVSLAYPLSLLVSSREASEAALDDVRVPAFAKMGQIFQVIVVFASSSGSPPSLSSASRVNL